MNNNSVGDDIKYLKENYDFLYEDIDTSDDLFDDGGMSKRSHNDTNSDIIESENLSISDLFDKTNPENKEGNDIDDNAFVDIDKKSNFVYKSNKYDKKMKEMMKKYCKTKDYVPLILPKADRILVLGDVHGDFKLVLTMLTMGNVLGKKKKEVMVDGKKKMQNYYYWTGGDTIVVQVGDQVDRCRPTVRPSNCDQEGVTVNDEDSDVKILKFFNKLNDQAMLSGGRVISLLGNHELMNAMGDIRFVSKKGLDGMKNYKDKNGYAIDDGKKARIYAFSPGNEYANLMGCTRSSLIIVGSNLFVHGGLIDVFLNMINENKKYDSVESLVKIDYMIKKWLFGLYQNNEKIEDYVTGLIQYPDSLFWTRALGQIPYEVDENYVDCKKAKEVFEINIFEKMNISHIIIGHTPQAFQHSHGINATCGNKIWRVDNGSSMAFNNYDNNYLRNKNNDTKNTYVLFDTNRLPQVLEILDDKKFNIIKMKF